MKENVAKAIKNIEKPKNPQKSKKVWLKYAEVLIS